jgi:hypothetical protein
MKLNRHGGGMRRCKRISRKRKSALGVCTWIEVWITWISRIGGGSVLTNSSMNTVGAHPLN